MFKRHVDDIVLHYSAPKHDTTDDSWMYSCSTDSMGRSKSNRTVNRRYPRRKRLPVDRFAISNFV